MPSRSGSIRSHKSPWAPWVGSVRRRQRCPCLCSSRPRRPSCRPRPSSLRKSSSGSDNDSCRASRGPPHRASRGTAGKVDKTTCRIIGWGCASIAAPADQVAGRPVGPHLGTRMSESRASFDVGAWCGLPLVRRVYTALVVGLALFILMLVLLREPFRGYLAEIHISGPAAAGLDLDDATRWLKAADPHVAAVAAGSGSSPRRLIRMTYVASRPTP